MRRSARLRTIADIAAVNEQRAASRLREESARVKRAQSRQHQLDCYREEYLQSVPDRAGPGLSAASLMNRSRFMSRLDEACASAERDLEGVLQQRHDQYQLWLKARARCRAIGEVIDRFDAEERAKQALDEQVVLDELAVTGERSRRDR